MVTKLFVIDQKEKKTLYSETFDLILPSAMTSNAIGKLHFLQITTVFLNLANIFELVKNFLR